MCHVCGSSEIFEGAWNMMYCFTLSQVVFLKGFLDTLHGSANTAGGNLTCETATEKVISNINGGNSTNKTENEGISVTKTKIQALMWAVGLLVTELVSVLLIAWSMSIVYRLACS
jgi:hypothetical protein